jgi:hypothetical protein
MSLLKYSAIAMALLLAGCGGGSDEPISTTTRQPDQSPVGLWGGTLTVTNGSGSPSRQVIAIIAPDGEYTAMIAPTPGLNDVRLIRGTGTVTSNNQFTAGGTAFSNVNFPDTNTTNATVAITGTVTTGSTITGTYSAGGETGTLTLTFQTLTNTPSSLPTAAGTYIGSSSALPGNSQSSVMNINTAGILDLSSTACVGFGSISTNDATKNIYHWSMTVSQNAGGCALASGTPLQGLAMLLPDSNSVANQRLAMLGSRTSVGYVFQGEK